MIPISDLEALPMQGGLDPHRSDEDDASAGKDSSLANPISRYTWEVARPAAADPVGVFAGESLFVKTDGAPNMLLELKDDGILQGEEGRESGKEDDKS